MTKFDFRCAQLDLARQMESVSFIKRFIDLLAANKYNALFLYLEDRISTPSYRLPKPGEAYSEEEIRELVAYGQTHGVELFPCVATLGHAERFLRHPELEALAEMRGGLKGRFGTDHMDTFCVSTPAFYDFLFRYMREVAELFPSPYFHAGLDEFWDFNLCPLCRKAAPDFRSEEKLFLDHVVKVRDFLHSIGKRMMMWPDMFELYHDILPQVPRDIIMTEWQYQSDVRFCQAHFNNQTQEDTLAIYRKLGFEVVISPADRTISNPASFIEYAEKYSNVKGMLLTGWEKNDTYPQRAFPIVAVTGRMMAGDSFETAFKGMTEYLFGLSDPLFDAAMKQMITRGFPRHFETIAHALLFARNCFGLDYTGKQADELSCLLLNHFAPAATRGGEVFDDISGSLTEMLLSHRLKERFMRALDYGLTPENRREIEKTISNYVALFRKREQAWSRLRPGILPNVFTEKVPEVEKRLNDALAELDNGSFIRVRSAHCDWYGMPRMKISFRLGGKWIPALSGNYKPDPLTDQLSEYFHSIDPKFLAADAVRFEHNGYGGVGLCYFALRKDGRTVKVPGKILEVENQVSHPEHLLTDDSRWCFLGSQNMRDAYENQELFNLVHRVDVELNEYPLSL